MSITSFGFLILACVGVIAYYLIPKRFQWIELLVLSFVFYYFAAPMVTILYLVVSTLIAYASSMASLHLKDSPKAAKTAFITAVAAVVVNVLIWFVVKGRDLWAFFLSKDSSLLGIKIVAALGMGYYTLQILGYIIDCYWQNIEPQKNIFKLFLFTVYFPQLTTGPISKYEDLKVLYEPHAFDYDNLARGSFRMLWGFIKKLVLAERVGIIVAAIASSPENYNGFYSWLLILLYPVQMYADFSGCMDIILGVSELFDIRLAENFNTPFFSRTSQEFWQRWHITLGGWAKNYVLYPLLRSGFMMKFSNAVRGKFGKKTGKNLVNLVAMFILWMTIGVWHGGVQYILGVSLWYWIILMSGELLQPQFKKIVDKLKIRTESFSWHLYQSVRTYIIYAIGASFFCVGITKALALLGDAGTSLFTGSGSSIVILFNGELLNLGIGVGDIVVCFVVVVLLFVVGVLREKYGYARNWLLTKGYAFRLTVWLLMFAFVLIWGAYGPGYNASDFIYGNF